MPGRHIMMPMRRSRRACAVGLASSVLATAVACGSSGGESHRLTPEAGAVTSVPRLSYPYAVLTVNGIALDDSAASGWVTSSFGQVFRLANGSWSQDTALERLAGSAIEFIAVSKDGHKGWAFTSGEALKYSEGRWSIADTVSRIFAVWVNDQATAGMALSLNGMYVLRGDDWKREDTADFGPAYTVAMAEDGGVGWAVDARGMLYRLAGTAWLSQSETSVWAHVAYAGRGTFVGVQRNGQIWLSTATQWERVPGLSLPELSQEGAVIAIQSADGGHSGWILTTGGLYRWRVGYRVELATPEIPSELRGIWMNSTGTRGYVYGERGIAFRYAGGAWVPDNPLRAFDRSLGSGEFNAIALNSAGTQGYAIGSRGIAARYADGEWRPDTLPSPVRAVSRWRMALSVDATAGWAVSDSGTVIELSEGEWKLVSPPHSERLPVTCVASTSSGQALAATAGGAFYEFRDRAWVRLPVPRTGGIDTVECVWPRRDRDGLSIWFQDRTIGRFRLEQGGLVATATESPSGPFERVVGDGKDAAAWALQINRDPLGPKRYVRLESAGSDAVFGAFGFPDWIGQDGKTALEVNAMGMSYSIGDRGIDYPAPFWCCTVDGARDPPLWMHTSGRHGWIGLLGGSMARIETADLPAPVELRVPGGSSLETLSGDFLLRRTDYGPLELQSIDVIGCSDPPLPLVNGVSYTSVRHDPHTITLSFTPGLLSRYKHSLCTLRFHVAYRGMAPEPVSAPLLLSFRYEGFSSWRLAAAGVLSLLLLNVVLVLAATRIRWLRGAILSPLGSNLVGLVVGKYLVIEPIIRYVRPIRLAMFRDYRRHLASSPAVERWTEAEYIPPEVCVEDDTPMMQTEGEVFAGVFERICRAPKGRVWLVKGPSGLGKTALLENWVGLALQTGRTPLLMRLGPGGTAVGEATVATAQFGDIDLPEESIRALLEAGGFVLLLDGLNEDRNPSATRAFIRRTSSRNMVVATSQHDPGWGGDVHIESVQLGRFGREQLVHLLAPEWVDRLLASDHLREAAGLPQTAQLVAAFIADLGRLPEAAVEVYEDLRERLPAGTERLNLDAAAWALFRENAILLPEGEGLSDSFLTEAVIAGVLTATVVDGRRRHRFVHERIHRYFVACFLATQPVLPLEQWHARVREGLPTQYWSEVLELLSEARALAVHRGGKPVSHLTDFLLEVGRFDAAIFRTVYRQADRFAQTGFVTFDREFVEVAARLLVGDSGS
jgi:hypothetical protein